MISSSYGAALSGIQAASARLSASANNIANSDTPGYQRQQVTTTSGVYGVEVAVERIDSLVQPDGQKTGESSDISLASELIDMKLAQVLYDANVNTLRVEENALGRILNLQV